MNKNTSSLSSRDLFFGGINGAIFGTMAIFVLTSTETLIISPLFIFLGFILLAIIGIAIGYFLSRYVAGFFFQLAKFGAVGAANFSVDLGVFSLLTFLAGTYTGPIISIFKAISFVAAVTNSYFWNKFWSFGDKSRDDIKKEFSQFFLVSLIGATINVGTAYTLINIIGPLGGLDERMWATASAAISAVAVLMWNFLGYKFIVFKN